MMHFLCELDTLQIRKDPKKHRYENISVFADIYFSTDNIYAVLGIEIKQKLE